MRALIVAGRSSFPSMIVASIFEQLSRGEVEVEVADGHGAPEPLGAEKADYLANHGYRARSVQALTTSLMLSADLILFLGGDGPIYPGRRYSRWVLPGAEDGEALEEWIRSTRTRASNLLTAMGPTRDPLSSEAHSQAEQPSADDLGVSRD